MRAVFTPTATVIATGLRLAFAGAMLALLVACAATAQKEDPFLGSLSGEPSYKLEVQSDDAKITQLLQTHLDLERYRHLPDLTATEVSSLMEQAEADAADLLGTEGYFNPIVRVSLRQPSEKEVAEAEAAEAERLAAQAQAKAAAGANVNAGADAPADSADGLAATDQPLAADSQADDTPIRAAPTVVVAVQRGPSTRIERVNLQFQGDIAQSLDLEDTIQRRVIRQFWQLGQGQRFSQDRWDAAKDRALRDLSAERYLNAQIASSAARIDADANQAELDFTLNSGPIYHFGDTTIQGSEHYSDDLVNRFLRIPTGDPYSLSRLLQAQQRLLDSGFFDSVYLYMDPKDEPEHTTVQAQLSEARLQKLVLGVGASTNNGPRVSVEHIHNLSPFFHWRSQVKASVDKREKNLSGNVLSQPDASFWRWSLGAAHTQELDEDQDIRSDTLRIGRLQTNEKIDRSLYAEYNRSSWFLIDKNTQTAGYHTFSALSANFAWTLRNFNSTTYPTEGYGFGAELGAGVAFGEKAKERKPFTRVLARWQSYHPLADVFDAELFQEKNMGRIQLRGQVGGVTAQQGAPVPAKLLFLTGGDGTVRGYPYRSLSAEDLYHNGKKYPQPGHYLLVGSAEWQKPIYSDGALTDWESTWFIDSGATAYEFKDLKLRTGIGAGARWRSPIGPFQADLAYGLKAKRLRLHLSVGFVF